MLVIDEETRATWRAQARKEHVKSILDFVGTVFVAAVILLVSWLFILVTPDQMSAEAEAFEEELEAR